MAPSFSNWSRTEHCSPREIARPSNEAEVVALVERARAESLPIKVVGAAHSWSAIAMSDGILVSLDAMRSVLEVDEARHRVRVQAGIRLYQLNEELAARGLAMSILGSVTEQSVAGVMATGTHGSSLVHGNIASFVVGLRLVTGQGEVLELDEDHPLFPAARVSLGALGIVTEVTVQVEPAFRLRESIEIVDFAQAVAEMDAIARSAEYVKLWWLPHTEAVIISRCDRTDAPGEVSQLGRWVEDHVVHALAFRFLLYLARVTPGVTPPANRLVARTYLDTKPKIGRSDHVLTTPMPPRHREMEYALAVERAGDALQGMRDLIDSQGLTVNFISELRFVRQDDAWMSPAHGRDTCQLGAYMARAPGIERYFSGFEAMAKSLEGRPHWGKEMSCTWTEISERYPRAEAFVEAAAKLDPQRLFLNPFLRQVLGSGD